MTPTTMRRRRRLPARDEGAPPGVRLAAAITLLLSAVGIGLSSGMPVEETVPATIASPSCLGEVVFPHSLHFEEIGISCVDCHHETDAAALAMPHADYFDDFWIHCDVCHRESGAAIESQHCANCHHPTPAGIADETRSAKVVIHKSCWQCHEVGTGAEASAACSSCHRGERDCD